MFRTYFGPTRKLLERLDEPRRGAFASELSALFGKARCDDGTVAIPFEYLEVIATKH